jgi:hypothetical protein
MVVWCSPRRSAISDCESPSAFLMDWMSCMPRVYAHTHTHCNPQNAFAVTKRGCACCILSA